MEDSPFFHSVEIEQLEMSLRREIIPQKELSRIAERLDALAGRIDHIGLKTRYQTLCGRVHWKAVDGEVDEIFDTAFYEKPDAEMAIDLLRRIDEVRSNYALSIESRQIIAAAERKLRPEGEEPFAPGTPLTPSPDEAERLAEHLYEIGHALYHSELRQACTLYDGLDGKVRARLDAHCKRLKGDFGALSDIDSVTAYKSAALPLTRAVIGFAGEVLRTASGYPTEDELETLFGEMPSS